MLEAYDGDYAVWDVGFGHVSSWGSLGVLLGFSWYKYFRDWGSHIKIQLRNLFLLGFSWGSLEVFLGFSWGSLGVLTSKSGTGFKVWGAFCWVTNLLRIHCRNEKYGK